MNRSICKTNTLIRCFFVICLLAICHIAAFPIDKNQQNEILERARVLIEKSDEQSLRMIEDIDSVIVEEALSDSIFIRFVVNEVGEYFRWQGRQVAAIELFLAIIEMLEQGNAPAKEYLHLYIPLGAAFEEVGMWNRAVEYYHKALSIAEQEKMKESIARIYNNVGAAYFNVDVPKAESYFLKALEINKELGHRKEMSINYSNLAGVYVQHERYDEALDYALRALQLIDKNTEENFYHFTQSNIASLYLLKKENHLAISYLKNAISYQCAAGNHQDVIQGYSLLAEAYEKSGALDSAYYYYRASEKELQKINNRDLEANTYERLSKFYRRRGDYVKAYELLNQSQVLKDSLTIVNNARKVEDFERIYNNEQEMRENMLIIKEMRLKEMQRDRQVTVIIVVVVLLVLLVIFLMARAQYNESLRKTNEALAQQKIALSEKEKELARIKANELNMTIDRKNRELSGYALTYTKDNEFITHICDELKGVLLELNPRDKEHKERIRGILTSLRQHSASDNWQEFKLYFEQVHPSFYDSLDEICPGITMRQKRLCAMLYIGLSTKEISEIMFREVRSIESARNRLRKKMDIPADMSINEFLTQKLPNNK